MLFRAVVNVLSTNLDNNWPKARVAPWLSRANSNTVPQAASKQVDALLESPLAASFSETQRLKLTKHRFWRKIRSVWVTLRWNVPLLRFCSMKWFTVERTQNYLGSYSACQPWRLIIGKWKKKKSSAAFFFYFELLINHDYLVYHRSASMER